MRIEGVSRANIGLGSLPAYIELGAYTALVGPNDAGKSLWLNVIEHALTGVSSTDDLRPGPQAAIVVRFADVDELKEVFEARVDGFRGPTDFRAPLMWARSFEPLEAMLRDSLEGDVLPQETVEWLSYLKVHLDDLGLRLLDVALQTPIVITASTMNDDDWVDVSWLAVDPADPRVRAIDEQLHLRTGEGLWNPLRESPAPPTNPELLPLAAFPLLESLPRSAIAVYRPHADGLARLRAQIDRGAVAEGRAFADRVARWMPPMLAARYRLVIRERANAPAVVSLTYADEAQDLDGFDLGDLARGWGLWLAVAIDLAHLELADATRYIDGRPPLGVVVIDEPEQHLHAHAQRAMSQWLATISERVQIIVATHSVAFTDPRGTRSVIIGVLPTGETPRDDRHAFFHNRWRSTVSVVARADDEDLAAALGWTRGELFASLETILFVEGLADKEVLEGLFAPHLRAAGILVSPIHGVTKAPAIAGIELVLKMPGVRRALLVDDLAEPAIADLMAMSDTELESHAAQRATSIEGKYVAVLLRALPLAWRESLEIYSHGEQDVIALLDERALDDALPESYPGHDIVRQRFDVEGKSFKSLMRDYGFRSNDRDWQVDFVKRVVAGMRAAGTRPEGLEEIIAQIATRPNRRP